MPMVPILNYPDIDGARYSRTSVEMSIIATAPNPAGGAPIPISAAFRVEGWTALSYQRKLTPGKGWGHRAKPQTRTRGKFEPSGELTLYYEDWVLVERYLAQAGNPAGRGPFEQPFQLTATLFEQALGTTRWDLIGCRIEQDGVAVDGGSDEELEAKLTLNVMDVMRDFQSAVYENTPFGQAGVVVTF